MNRLRGATVGIGLVDEDPHSANTPRSLAEYRVANEQSGIVLMECKHGSERRLIVLCPRLEEWLYDRAKECGLNPCEFGLPKDPRQLHSDPRYDRRQEFRNFLQQLMTAHPATRMLANWLAD
ncbi:MAG: hypothetical protein NZ739_07390 [Verrucomicrobiae bacterium]|nr:hypothetical protein [Verrucomicrobiae bacterium]MCX7722694.1 hypothetical protein [Verrucomicrobiae bacterium]